MDKSRFGAFMVLLRKEKGITQKELANELKVSDKAVSRWENGKNYPDIEIMQKIAEFFDVTVNELFQGGRIPEEQLKEVSDRNIITALRRLKNNKDKDFAVIVFLFTAVVVLICLLCQPVDKLIRGIKVEKLSVTSSDTRTIISCIDGYITSETGNSAALSEIDVILNGDKTLDDLSIQGITVKGNALFCSTYFEGEELCQVNVSYEKDTVKAGAESITVHDLTEFINVLDFAKYDPDYSDQNTYGVLSVEREDYGDYEGNEAGKTSYIYEAESKTFAEIKKGDPPKGQYVYIVLLKYETDHRNSYEGESMAHIFWEI